MRVRDAVDVRAQRLDRVDPEPEEVRRVEVQEEPEREHPLPELGRVREVAGVPVGVPALHHAVLDHQTHAALARVVDERREDTLRLAQVLGHALSGVAADEGPDGYAAERSRSVDAPTEVRVILLALRGIRAEVVVVVRERGDDETVPVESAPNSLLLGLVECLGLDVARGERPVAELRPCSELERLVAVVARPGGDLLEAAFRHARGEEPELHDATASEPATAAWVASTSTHCPSRDDEASTASVIDAARSPSAKVGVPSGRVPPRTAS